MFQIPFPKTSDSEHTSLLKLEAKEAWKIAILRTREETGELKTRFEKHNIFLCEHHFEQDCIESFLFKDAKGNEKTHKRLQTGSVPTFNLPMKTLDLLPDSSTPQQRRPIVHHEAPSTAASSTSRAKKIPSFDDLKTYFQRECSYLQGWSVTVSDSDILIEMREPGYLISKYYVKIGKTLDVIVSIYGATVPDASALFLTGSSALFLTGSSRLLCKYKDMHDLLCSLQICCGISTEHPLCFDETFVHVIPLVATKQQAPVNYSQVMQSSMCEVLVEQGTCQCKPCCKVDEKIQKEASHAASTMYGPVLPAKPKAPLSKCSSAKLQATVRDERVKLKEAELKCAQLEKQIQRMEEINSHGVRIDDEMSNSFLSILNDTNLQSTSHMRLVFEQQQKAMMTNKYSRRWHPHFIEFCLSIHAKSSSVYNELRKSEQNPDGILYLPQEQTLRDYPNHFKPGAGFMQENIDLLKTIAKSYKGITFIETTF